MIVLDTGPLIALVARDQRDHRRCLAALHDVSAPLVTSCTVLTEALHLVGRLGGWPGQEAVWRWARHQRVEVRGCDGPLLARCEELMRQYRDVPMDFADATLVALAERFGMRRAFTLDGHFRIYRPNGIGTLEIMP